MDKPAYLLTAMHLKPRGELLFSDSFEITSSAVPSMEAVLIAWDSIDEASMQNLVQSMPNKLIELI